MHKSISSMMISELLRSIINLSCCGLLITFWVAIGAPKNPATHLAFGDWFEATKWIIHAFCAYMAWTQLKQFWNVWSSAYRLAMAGCLQETCTLVPYTVRGVGRCSSKTHWTSVYLDNDGGLEGSLVVQGE